LSNPSDLLTRVQAAEYLGVKPQTLAAWACLGRYQLPFLRIGNRLVRYRKSDLDRWLAARTVNAIASFHKLNEV
jgi:excisionase family DNA binding protein